MKSIRPNAPSRGFTLIELLVVIAIIAILAAILFPVFAQAKAAAKRTADLSNVKNITTSLFLYTNDSDDAAPIVRIVENGSPAFFSPQTKIWKDACLPYIKNGGRTNAGATGTLYNDVPGSGGIFQNPLNESAWSNAQSDGNGPGKPGDETTRFPRSYALNKDAYRNESNCAQTFFPEVYYGTVYNASGNMTSIQSPAGTAMIAPTRRIYPDIESSEMGRGSSSIGSEQNLPAPNSLIASSGNRLLTFGFFDGHAKQMDAFQSMARDAWGVYGGPNGTFMCNWGGYNRGGPGNGMPWRQGIETNMRQIGEFK